MGHKHTRDEVLDGAVAAAFDVGLSQVTFGRVAGRLGISDRMVVYYFPSKDELIGEVLLSLGARMQQTLEPALRAGQPDHRGLVRAAWPLLATEAVDPVFALFFEANGLAAAGREPYRSIVPLLVDGWLTWTAELVQGPPSVRRREAAAAVALLDGLLLLRQIGGADAATHAARALGVLGRR